MNLNFLHLLNIHCASVTIYIHHISPSQLVYPYTSVSLNLTSDTSPSCQQNYKKNVKIHNSKVKKKKLKQ